MNKRILISSLTSLILGLMFSFAAAETTTGEQPNIDNLAASEAKMLQTNISALRMQVMDNQQQNINWWLAAIALMGAIVPYLFYKQSEERMLNQFRTLLDQAKEHSKQTQISANQAQEYLEKAQTLANQAEEHSNKAQTLANQVEKSASNAQAHLGEIKNFHSEAKQSTDKINELSEQMKKYSSQAQDKESKQQKESIEAAKDFAKHSDTTLIEQLRAQAILLSNKADQSKIYQDHLQAFYAWQAVLQQNNRDEQANFMAGIEAFQLHEKSSWEENIYWPKEAEKYYLQILNINPRSYKAANNLLFSLLCQYQALKAEKLNSAEAKLEQARNLVNDFLSQNPRHKENLAYNHACLCALEGNAAEAIKQLRLAQYSNHFPNKEHIEQDDGLDNIRHTPEFQAWFKEAFPESSSKS